MDRAICFAVAVFERLERRLRTFRLCIALTVTCVTGVTSLLREALLAAKFHKFCEVHRIFIHRCDEEAKVLLLHLPKASKNNMLGTRVKLGEHASKNQRDRTDRTVIDRTYVQVQ